MIDDWGPLGSIGCLSVSCLLICFSQPADGLCRVSSCKQTFWWQDPEALWAPEELPWSVDSLLAEMASNNSSSKNNREWYPPHGDNEAVLKLYNSLVDEKVPFIPAAGASSKQISWYACGPTVYDAAHMGHARNYVTFDVIRRVLEDYFGFNVLYVMNVTDVDDKIILRARRNHLLQQYKQEQQDPRQVGGGVGLLQETAAQSAIEYLSNCVLGQGLRCFCGLRAQPGVTCVQGNCKVPPCLRSELAGGAAAGIFLPWQRLC